MNSNEYSPHPNLNDHVLNLIKKDLNPNHKMIFLKLIFIKSFVGFLTLTFCPQFNFSLTNNYELFHYLHHNFGHNICSFLCGLIFIGSGASFSAYLLKRNEIEKVYKSKTLYYLFLTLIANLIFGLLGKDIYFLASLFWFLGAFLGGIFLFKANKFIRIQIFNY